MQGSLNLLILLIALLASVVTADISQTTITSGYNTYGNGLVGSGYIQITPSQSQTAGIVLYSTQQTVGYGFTTEFTYTSTGCSGGGGDGFNFIVSPSTSFSTLQKGGSMAVEGQTNIAVVAYDGYKSQLRICSVPSGTSLSYSSNCVSSSLAAIRCTGSSHTFKIIYTPNSAWQLWVDGTSQSLTGPQGLTGTLTLNANSQAYVGFAGATGDAYMDQRIISWTFTSTPTCALNNGGCDTNANCSIVAGSISCTCNNGYTGDGYTCSIPPVDPPVTPIAPPVDPPVYVAPPVDPPVYVAPPVDPPVYVAPPVDVPVSIPPVDPPVVPPVAVPVSVPVSVPVAVPISVPVSVPPISTPIAVNPPIAVPPVMSPVTTPPVPVLTPVNAPMSFEVPVAMPVVIPILECFDDLQNGSFIAYFGYNNTMGEQVSVPVGSMNTFGSPSFLGQPTTFQAGRSNFYPDVAFAYLWNGRTLIWTLTSYRLTLDTSDTSRKCPSFARFSLTFYTERELTDQEVNTLVENLANNLGISVDRIIVKSIKYTPVTPSKKRDLSVAELEMEIAAANSTQQNEPTPSQAVQTLVETSKNTTELNQVLDPNGTSDLQFLGLKTEPTGVEQSGNAVPQAAKGDSPRSLLGSTASVRVAALDVTLLWCCLVILSLLHITVR